MGEFVMSGIGVNWVDDTYRALQLDLPVKWAWDDLYLAHNFVYEQVTSVPHTVDLIYFADGMQTLPKNYFRQLRAIADGYPQNCGLVIWTGCNRLTIEMVRSLTRTYPDLAQRYALADTLLEAYTYASP